MNDAERRRERMAELGRKSGEARRKRRSRSVLDALRARVAGNPDMLVEQLLASPPGAVKAVALLERAGLLEPDGERQEGSQPPSVASRVTYADIVGLAAREGQEHHLLGFELSDEQRAHVVAEYERRNPEWRYGGEGVPEEARSHVPSRDEDGSISALDPAHPLSSTEGPDSPSPSPERIQPCSGCGFNFPRSQLAGRPLLCASCSETACARCRRVYPSLEYDPLCSRCWHLERGTRDPEPLLVALLSNSEIDELEYIRDRAIEDGPPDDLEDFL